MGRGLGKLQREILAMLDSDNLDEIISVSNVYVTLRQGYYDLRDISGRMRRNRSINKHFTGSFHAAFTRAAHSLIQRGELERVRGWMPVESANGMTDADHETKIAEGAEGLSVRISDSLLRFVRRPE